MIAAWGRMARPALACLVSLLSVSAQAADDGPPLQPVVMVNAPTRDALLVQAALRASAELRAAGFQVERGECGTALDVTCGRPWPAGAVAVATVVLQRSGEAVVIDVQLARASGLDPIVLRRDLRPTSTALLEPAVIGVCASELVHASVTASARPAPPREPIQVFPFVDGGAAGLVSVGLAYGVRVRAGVLVGENWGLSLRVVSATAHVPASSTGLELETGRSWEIIPQVEVSRRWRREKTVSPEFSLGAGVHYLTTSGRFVKTARVWTPFLSAGAGLAFKLADSWSLHADLQLIALKDRLEVELTNPEQPVVFPSNGEASAVSWSILPVLSLGIRY